MPETVMLDVPTEEGIKVLFYAMCRALHKTPQEYLQALVMESIATNKNALERFWTSRQL